MSLINEDVHTDSSLQRRWSYHVIGLHLLENNPLMGVGPGNFQQEYMSESFRYETDTFQGGRLLHNLYLSIAAQSGLITLIAFVFLGVTTLRSLWRMQGSRYEPGIQRISVMLEMGLVSFLLNSFFLPHEYQKYLWLLLALPPALEWAVAHNPAGPRRTDREDPAPLPQGTEAAAFQSRITQ
jgi:O-antigen ligase